MAARRSISASGVGVILSAWIAAAQQVPQVKAKRNPPVAVLASADYFEQCQAAIKPAADTF
ncbi:MAG: hypothetical protein IPN53_25040 [Comamonadaceae bacterium]|nr:hypothetical protein [Comamonadaceae bacterium]